MNKNFIEKIQERILELLPEEKRQNKAILLADSCSELSRLVASWIEGDKEADSQIILKGNNVCSTNKSHDILAIFKGSKVYVIDSTIWQFFPNEESIFVGEYATLDESIRAVTEKYQGQWKKNEDLTKGSFEDKDKWIDIIHENIDEVLNADEAR